MKKIFYTALLALVALAGQAHKNDFQLKTLTAITFFD